MMPWPSRHSFSVVGHAQQLVTVLGYAQHLVNTYTLQHICLGVYNLVGTHSVSEGY